MARKDYERELEWIPPADTEEPGTRDDILAFSYIPSENVSEYIVRRYLPPRQVDRYIEGKDYTEGHYKSHMRRRTPMYFQELRDLDGVKILEKHLLPIEAAYIAWRDSANQVLDFEEAFPGHPELLVLADQNPSRHKTAVERFLQGKPYGRSERLSSTGDRIYSFGTVITQRTPRGQILFNATRYSNTTSGHQGLVRSMVKPDLMVYGGRFGEQHLEEALKHQKLIATSSGRGEQVNVIMVTHGSMYGSPWVDYFLEIRRPDGSIHYETLKKTEKGVPRKAYIEYIDSDNQLVPFEEAFPDHPELRLMKHRNPWVGKSRFHLPASLWHRPGTKLLAVSYVQTARGILEVDLYRTTQNKYFRQQGMRSGVGAPWWWNYISRDQAILDWRDADEKHATYAEAFDRAMWEGPQQSNPWRTRRW